MTEVINMHISWPKYRTAMEYAMMTVRNEDVQSAFVHLRERLEEDRSIFVIGNGGSAAIANHWATDFAKGIATSTTIKPKVRSLVCNESLLTAEANDNGYDSVFANQLRTWGKYRDVLVCISSSGNSPNIKEAVDVALSHGLFVIGISGFEKGNYLDRTANIGIHVDASNYGIIEDVSSNIMHCLSQSLRKHFAVPGIDTRSFTF